MKRFKKGSREAKIYMARLRAKRRGYTLKRKKMPRNSANRKIYKPFKHIKTMAKKRYYRKKGGITSNLKPVMVGLGVGIAEPFVNQLFHKLNINIADDYAKIIGGFGLTTLKQPLVKQLGYGLIIIGTRNVVAQKVNFLNNAVTTTQTTTNGATF